MDTQPSKRQDDLDRPMNSWTPEPWIVSLELRPDLDDDPMGIYRVEPARETLTQRYFTSEPDTQELDAVHTENEANRARIEACVNGCAGLNPAAYRACVEALQQVRREFATAFNAEKNAAFVKGEIALPSPIIHAVLEALALAEGRTP